MAKLRALLVGATGIAGQQFVSALRDHPWFEIGAIAASPRNAGKRYDEAVSSGWFLPEAIPDAVAGMRLQDPAAPPRGVDLVFSAVESDVARELEPRLAADFPVVSAASTFRMEPDVPLLIPPINAAHAGLVVAQRARGWRGWVAPIPNCTTTGLAVVLAPLAER
ncbi:MAG TPA: aspartate-semialdehyde dehydrogenase, partial [Myxococcaceae bacterium]